jgi:hypothetical protein
MESLAAPPALAEPTIPLSIRPGDKISALLEILAELTGTSPAEYAGDGLSESLFLYLAAQPERLELAAGMVADFLQRGETLQHGSALDLLVRRGVLEIRD